MALDDRPWWGKKHTLFGGETFTAEPEDGLDKPLLGIVIGDRFRVEKNGVNITLTPHSSNEGTLRDAATNAMRPINLEKVTAPAYERAYAMHVAVEIDDQRVLKTLYLVERPNGSVAITEVTNGIGSDDSTCNVER